MLNAIFTLDLGEKLYLFFLSIGQLLALLIALRSVYFFGPTALALRPVVPFSFFFSLVHFLTPAIKLLEGRFRYQDGYLSQTYIYNSMLMTAIYLLCVLLLSSKQFSPIPRPVPARESHMESSKFDFPMSISLFFIGLFFAAQDLYIIFNEIGIVRFHLDVHSFNSERSRFRLLANLMTLGAALYLGHKLSVRGMNFRSISLLFCMAVPVAFYALTLSSRNTFFFFGLVFITVLLGFYRAPSKRGLKKLSLSVSKRSIRLTFGVFAVIALVFIVSSEITEQRYGRFDSAYMLERREYAFYYALEGGFGNDENVLWLIENDEYPLIWGYSYFSGFVSLVPRNIWPSKPSGAGPILTNYIWPGRYVQGAAGNNSVTTGMTTEAFMNFGTAGLFLVPFIWAFGLSRSMRLFHSSRVIYHRIAWLIISLLLSTSFIYQEFMGLFARGAVIVAPLFFLGFLSCSLKIKRSSIAIQRAERSSQVI
jgi:hypothetical protein